MKAARLAWLEGQRDLDPDKLVFLDETATHTKMARRYGRAPRGERCRIAVPFGHWKTITVTAGLRASGLTATALLDGPRTGARFQTEVENTWGPHLKRGDRVVLDNLPTHKVAGIRERIEAAGARLLYLPAYAPDFQPDRASLRQAQGHSTRRSRAHRYRPLERHQTNLPALHT